MATDDDTASLGYMWPDGTIRAEKPPAPKRWRIPRDCRTNPDREGCLANPTTIETLTDEVIQVARETVQNIKTEAPRQYWTCARLDDVLRKLDEALRG